MDENQTRQNKIQPPAGMSPIEIWLNFQKSDINRWAFRNIDKFIPHDVIPKSTAPLTLGLDPCNISNIRFDNHEGVSISVSEALAYLMVDALVVVKDRVMVAEQYYEGMQPDVPHLLFSASKPFAAAMIANLIHHGFLHSENDLLVRYVPELMGTAFDGVTIRHLLDMQSGIDIRALDDLAELERASGFAPPDAHENILSTALKLNRKKFQAGRKTDYNSINTDMLSLLAARVTGKSAASLLRQFIFEPMGAEYDALVIRDPVGINELGGGLAVTARDLAKLGLAMLNDGAINHQQVLPKGTMRCIFSTTEPKKWRDGWLSALTPQAKAYRAQLYLCGDEFDSGAFFAVGSFGNALYMNPLHNTVIALLSSHPTAIDVARFNTQMAMLRELSNQI